MLLDDRCHASPRGLFARQTTGRALFNIAQKTKRMQIKGDLKCQVITGTARSREKKKLRKSISTACFSLPLIFALSFTFADSRCRRLKLQCLLFKWMPEPNAFVCLHLCPASAGPSFMPSAESHRSVSGGSSAGWGLFFSFLFLSTSKVSLFHSTSKNNVWSEYRKMQIKSIPAENYLVLCSTQTFFFFVYRAGVWNYFLHQHVRKKKTFWMFSPNIFFACFVFPSFFISFFFKMRWANLQRKPESR